VPVIWENNSHPKGLKHVRRPERSTRSDSKTAIGSFVEQSPPPRSQQTWNDNNVKRVGALVTCFEKFFQSSVSSSRRGCPQMSLPRRLVFRNPYVVLISGATNDTMAALIPLFRSQGLNRRVKTPGLDPREESRTAL